MMDENRLDRLYNLLPVIYRMRDAEQGYPLQALLRVIAEQVNVVEDDISQLYENWFIETSADWVVPYIGDLVGYQLANELGESGNVTTAEARARNRNEVRAGVMSGAKKRNSNGKLPSVSTFTLSK